MNFNYNLYPLELKTRERPIIHSWFHVLYYGIYYFHTNDIIKYLNVSDIKITDIKTRHEDLHVYTIYPNIPKL